MKKTAKAIMLGLATLLITFCAFVGISAYKTRRDATARLNEFRELGASKNPTAIFASLRHKYGSKLHPIEGCTEQLCQYEMSLSNRSISTLRIAPYGNECLVHRVRRISAMGNT